MSLFDYLFRREPPEAAKVAMTTFQTLTGYEPSFHTWGGCIYESELVRASIDAIARNTGKLRVEFIGAARPSLTNRLLKGPNEFQTWYQFLYRLATILEVDNTAFIIPIFDRYGDVTGLYPILPAECKVMEYKGQTYLKYTFMQGKTSAIERELCGMMLKMQYKHDFFGESNKALDPTMSLINMQNQGIEEGIKNSATYRFAAQANNLLNDGDAAKEAERFSDINFRKRKKGGLLLFPSFLKDIKQIDSKPFVVDAEQMKTIQTNVYNYFGVNEDVLQGKVSGDSWSAFYESKIEPFAIQLSEVLTKMLYTFREQAQGSHVIATSNRLQYMTNKDKLDVSSQLMDRGVLSRNDVRDIWNLPRIEDGDGYIIRGEYYDATDKLNEGGNDDASEE